MKTRTMSFTQSNLFVNLRLLFFIIDVHYFKWKFLLGTNLIGTFRVKYKMTAGCMICKASLNFWE